MIYIVSNGTAVVPGGADGTISVGVDELLELTIVFVSDFKISFKAFPGSTPLLAINAAFVPTFPITAGLAPATPNEMMCGA
jgi:hypothetical protein